MGGIPLLTAEGLASSTPGKTLFSDLSFSLDDESRAALVGANGSGKSTLLQVLAKLVEPDAGTLVYRRGLVVEYVPQFVPSSLADVSLLDAVIAKLNSSASHLDEWKAYETLSKFGFGPESYDLPFKVLSGGEANRAMLARAMSVEPNLLLLDEPTNHMDSEAIIEFERFLLEDLRIPFCIVSHDRDLLDRCTEETFILRDKRLYHFRIPFSDARVALQSRDENEAVKRDLHEREIKRVREASLRVQLWAKKNSDFAPKYRALLTRVRRLEESLPFVTEADRRNVSLAQTAIRANYALEIRDFDVSVGDGVHLFSIDHFGIRPGDRAVILGRNGVGKTTLIKHIISAFHDDESDVHLRFNPQTRIGYYDQELHELNPNDTLIQHVGKNMTLPMDHMTKELVKAGFPYKLHHTKVGTLSGGEKARLHFLSLNLMKPSMWVLDEPTNHIDVAGIEQLEDSLTKPGQTSIIVSHDRRFISNVATRFFLIHDGRLREIGDIEPYYELLAEKATLEHERITHGPNPEGEEETDSQGDIAYSLDQLVEEITTTEQHLAGLNENARDYKTLTDRLNGLYKQLEQL